MDADTGEMVRVSRFGVQGLAEPPVLEWLLELLVSWPIGLSTVDSAGGKRSPKKKPKH